MSFLENHPNDELAVAFVDFILDEVSNNLDLGDVSDYLADYDINLVYLEAETSEESEIQNGIDILETYLPADPQTPSGTPFGGSTINPNGGPDLIGRTNGDLNILAWYNQPLATAPIGIQEFRMKALFFMGTFLNGEGETVAQDYLQQFHENEAIFDHYNPTLSTMVMNSTKMRSWLKIYGKAINDELAAAGGDINGVVPPETDRVALNETHALTMLINDTQVTNVFRLGSYNFNAQTGEWDCYFLVNVVDHFGLDDGDVIEFQNNFLGGAGFVSWWALQHRRGWWPFRTDIWFVAHLSGEI